MDDALSSHVTMGAAVDDMSEVEKSRSALCRGIVGMMHTAVCEAGKAAVSSRNQSMREELEHYREGWTIRQAKGWCRSSEPAFSVHLG